MIWQEAHLINQSTSHETLDKSLLNSVVHVVHIKWNINKRCFKPVYT